MSKLVMLKGLPASGKSTYAKELVAQGYKRVNKDDLRAMIDSGKWSKKNEENIVELRDIMVIQYLDNGFNVVVDDTNFHPSHEEALREICDNCDAEFETMFIDVNVRECILRDASRGDKAVGSKVIFDMWKQYVKPKAKTFEVTLYDAYIFDIDGTLAIMGNRSPYEWSKVGEDSLNEHVAMILDALSKEGNHIFIVSGRDGCCLEETEEWLQFHGIAYDGLFMRPTGDKSKDTDVKLEIYNNEFKDKFNVLGVFDDRDCVVDLWRSLGLTCFQCGYGNF